jgi:teichoic acid transport system permease protein
MREVLVPMSSVPVFNFAHPPRGAPSLRSYLRLLLAQRDLAVLMALSEHRADAHGLRLGRLWHVLTPLLRIGVYALVFGLLLAGRRPEGFVAFLAIGLFLFGLLQAIVMQGGTIFDRRQNLLTSLYFPRALLPISVVLRQALVFRFEALVMAIAILASGKRPSSDWIVFLVVLLPLALVFALGLALVVSVAVGRLGDVRRLLPLVFRILFYLSGVLFPLDVLLETHPLERFLPLNPFYVYVTLARRLLLGSLPSAADLWVSALVWAFVSIVGGLLLFVRREHDLARS